MLSARSKEKFPSLASRPVCHWHEDCTPMDCDNWRTVKNIPTVFEPVLTQNQKEQREQTGRKKAAATQKG